MKAALCATRVLIMAYSLNAGSVFFHNSCQLPRLFSGLSDDDAACRIADFRAVYARCNHGCAGLLPAAVRFGIRRCRGCVRCRARCDNWPYCAQLFFRRLRKNTAAAPQLTNTETESVYTVAKRLAMLALPVSCANIMVPVTSSIDMLLVPNCLYASGYTIEQATTLFGYLTGMGMPLVMMATIVTVSLAAGIVPAISEAFTLGDKLTIIKKSRTAMNICCLITLPAAAGLWVLATPIAQMIYNAPQAGEAIRHLAPSACLLGIHQVTTGMLQGIGKTAVPMWNMLLSAVLKIGAVMFLTVTPLNIVGAAWASNINFGLAALLNIVFLLRSGITFNVKVLAKLLAATLLMAAAAELIYTFVNGFLAIQ